MPEEGEVARGGSEQPADATAEERQEEALTFQKGHGAFPGNPGSTGKRGQWKRPDVAAKGLGFQKNHPAFYRGGSVPGHAPTNLDPQHLNGPDGFARKNLNDPTSLAYPYRFDQPRGMENRKKGGRQAKSKLRECLEAVQNGTRGIEKRFPPGMLKRMRVLQETAEDPTHRDFMNAQRLVLQILTTLGKQPGDMEGRPESEGGSIELLHGHVDVPLPGAVKKEAPPALEGTPAAPAPSEVNPRG